MLKTHQIDPVFHTNNNRTEFKLRGKVILSDLRLSDLHSTSPDVNSQYIFNGGALNLIKTLTLTSHGQTVDTVREFSKWAGFKNLNRTTESMSDISKYLNGSKLSLDTTEEFFVINDDRKSNAIRGSANLNSLMPYLSATNTLCFDDLILTIEWNTSPAEVFVQGNRPANFTVSYPTLIYDEYLGPDADDRVKEWRKTPVLFNGVENDLVSIGAVAAGATQTFDGRIRAFDSKFLRNVVLMTDNTTGNSLLGHVRSTAMFNEKWNLRVNGVSLLPFNGIENPNTKLATMDDWGNFFCFMNGQYLQPHTSVGGNEIDEMSGQLSYLSLKVDNVINQLDLVYQRSGNIAASSGVFREATNVYVFGLVGRFVQFKNGRLFTGMLNNF